MTDLSRLQALIENDPKQAIALLKELESKTVRPHAAQQVVLDSDARFRIMNCGRRWGKTVLASKIFIQKSRKPNRMLWWVAPTYKVVKRGYAEVLRQLPDGVLAHDPPPDSHFDAGRSVILRFKNGTRMEFYSAERPEGMLGAAVDFVVFDEAAIMKGNIWNQIVSPTLMDRQGGALLISTPRGRNWFYQEWLKGQDADEPLYASWTFATQDNPTLPAGEADRMAKSMPRLEADQEIYAKWLADGSSVFKIADTSVQRARVLENGFVEGMPPNGFVVMGIDLAKTNDYTVLYACNASNRRNCYFERWNGVSWGEQKRRIASAVKQIMAAGGSEVMLVMDSTGVGDPIVEDMEMHGYNVVPINFTTHKANMVKLLAKDLEDSQAFVLDTKVDEFEDYTMTMSEAGRLKYSATEGGHDDVVSAKMLSHWGCVNEGVPDVQVLSSDQSPAELAAAEKKRREDGLSDDPAGIDLGNDSWADLVDDDAPELSDEQILDSIGLAPPRRPTTNELLARADLWFD